MVMVISKTFISERFSIGVLDASREYSPRQSLDDFAARQRIKLTLNTSDCVSGTQTIRTSLQTVLRGETTSTSHWRLWLSWVGVSSAREHFGQDLWLLGLRC
jgi:hypothetical protein